MPPAVKLHLLLALGFRGAWDKHLAQRAEAARAGHCAVLPPGFQHAPQRPECILAAISFITATAVPLWRPADAKTVSRRDLVATPAAPARPSAPARPLRTGSAKMEASKPPALQEGKPTVVSTW